MFGLLFSLSLSLSLMYQAPFIYTKTEEEQQQIHQCRLSAAIYGRPSKEITRQKAELQTITQLLQNIDAY